MSTTTFRPVSDQDCNWYPSTGSDHYALVDEVTPDDGDHVEVGFGTDGDELFGLDSDDIDSAWEKEITDRVRAVEGGTATGIDYDKAMQKIEKRFNSTCAIKDFDRITGLTR